MFLYISKDLLADRFLTANAHNFRSPFQFEVAIVLQRDGDHGDGIVAVVTISQNCYRLLSSAADRVPAFTVPPVAVYLVSSKAPNEVW
jgi:hypothetical protein